jgi:hypothetical protein
MSHILTFNSRIGLYELRVDQCRIRFGDALCEGRGYIH